MLGRHERGERLPRRSRGSLDHALAAARDQLGIEIECVSRGVRATDLTGAPPPRTLERRAHAEAAAVVPIEAGDGRLYGTLVCRSLDERELDDRDRAFLRVLGRVVGAHVDQAERDRVHRRTRAEASGLQALLAAIEARDSYTGAHSRSVVDLSVRVARELSLEVHDVAQVEQVALLHDVGKVAVPDSVLQKRGPLTEAEFELIRRHPAVGARIVGSVEELSHLAPAIRSGHERWDGRGYPDGLAGEDIPVLSRITFVCDAYDAMVSHRPYREALTPKTAVAEIRGHAGSQFCPFAAGALLSVLERRRTRGGNGTRSTIAPPV